MVNSAKLPRLNENLHPWFKHDVPKRSDVEMNKLFCSSVRIAYIKLLVMRNAILSFLVFFMSLNATTRQLIKMMIRSRPNRYESRSFIFA